MNITIKSLGIPVASLSSNAQQIELPTGTTIEQLLRMFSKNEDYEKLKTAKIMVNNISADERTVLNDGDEVIIMRVLGGG